MEYTPNYNLRKPGTKDVVSINDFNTNSDKIDTALTPSADPTLVPDSNGPSKLSTWVSGFANRTKAITGKANWYDTPDVTLADTKAHIDASAPHSGHETPSGAQAKADGAEANAKAYSDSKLTVHRNAVVLDHPDSSVTDAKIGERTIDDTSAPTGDTGTLSNLLSGLGFTVKSITGKSSWQDEPDVTLAETKAHIDAPHPHSEHVLTSDVVTTAAPNKILKLDADGKLPVSVVSGFDAQVRAGKLNEMSAPDGDVSMNGHKLTNLAAPASSADAATKGYVDATIQGLDIKDSVEVATTANLNGTYSSVAKTLTATANGALSVDGITSPAGARVLVKDQTDGKQNGIYVVASYGSATTPWVLTRADDFNADVNINAGAFVFVTNGAQNGHTGWVLTNPNDDAVVMDLTALSFTQFSGAGSFEAGVGLTRTGNTVDLDVASATALGGVKVGANVSVAADGTISVAAHPATHPASMITGLATVATSGKYTDLLSVPAAFNPSAHKSTHAIGGSDVIAPSDIGAVPTTDVVTSATANKILKLDANSKLPASITGDADTVDGKHADSTANNLLVLDSTAKVPTSSLPIASATVLGAVKVGTNMSVDGSGVISVAAPYSHPATHPASMITGLATVATSGSYTDLSNKPINLPANGGNSDTVDGKHADNTANNLLILDASAKVPTGNLPIASTTILGGVKVGANVSVDGSGVISVAAPYSHPATHPASMITGLATVATSGSYNDLSNKPTIPTTLPANGGNSDTVDGKHADNTANNLLILDASAKVPTGNLPIASATVLGGVKVGSNVSVDGSGVISVAAPYSHPATHPASMITGLATVATSGSYNDLSNKPTIPTSLPANGGDSDTVDGKHASDLVINLGATPSIQAGLDASKPTVGTVGRIYIATDTNKIYRDSGTTWVMIGGTDTIAWSNVTGKPSTFSPTAHKSTHATGGSDAIAPSDIGAPATTDVVLLKTSSTDGYFDKTATSPAGTARLNYSGYLYATKVYNAVYNDYAEYFLKDEEIEAGDVVCKNPDGKGYVKANTEYCKAVVGVMSNEYAQCIGGEKDLSVEEQEKKYAPLGMSGRVSVKVVGKVEVGDLLVSSNTSGVAMAATEYIPGTVIGKALESYNSETVGKVKMLIVNC